MNSLRRPSPILTLSFGIILAFVATSGLSPEVRAAGYGEPGGRSVPDAKEPILEGTKIQRLQRGLAAAQRANELEQLLPGVFHVVAANREIIPVLAGFAGRAVPPAASGLPYDPGQ